MPVDTPSPLSCPHCNSQGPFTCGVKLYCSATLAADGRFTENLADDALEPLSGNLQAGGPNGAVAHEVECGECEAAIGDVFFDERGATPLASGPGPEAPDPISRMKAVVADDPRNLVLDVDFGASLTIRDASRAQGSEDAEIAHWVAEEFDDEPDLFGAVLARCHELGARVRYAQRSSHPPADAGPSTLEDLCALFAATAKASGLQLKSSGYTGYSGGPLFALEAVLPDGAEAYVELRESQDDEYLLARYGDDEGLPGA